VADENQSKASPPGQPTGKAGATVAAAAGEPEEHYEEVSEYRIGEGPPPIALVVMFALIVLWATLSWIPFFGY